jgi:hypothetical protein
VHRKRLGYPEHALITALPVFVATCLGIAVLGFFFITISSSIGIGILFAVLGRGIMHGLWGDYLAGIPLGLFAAFIFLILVALAFMVL